MWEYKSHVVTVKEPWISSLSSNNEWNKSYRFYVIFMHDVWENPSNMPNIMITFTGSKHNHQSQILIRYLNTFPWPFKCVFLNYYINVNWSEIFYDLVDWLV